MLRKIIRESILFIFSIGLVFYVLIWFLFDFLVDLFMGTKLTKLIFLAQKGLEKYTESFVVKVVELLERGNLWY